MSAASIDVSCVIKHISDRIGDYDKPESLMEWCRKAMKDYSPRSLKLMRISVHNNLNRIEKLEGYSLMEKLQLVFIFSRPVRDGFVQLLKDAKFKIKQDEKKRISRFSTEDGSIVRFSDHHPGVKYFQGVLCQNTPWQKSANKDRIARENEGGQEDVEKNNTNPEMDEELESMEQVQEEIDEDNPVELEPKQEADEDMAVGVDFGQGAFNGRINYEELDAQEFVYPGFPGEMKPETSVRLQKRGQNPTTENGKRVKTSDSIATSSNQKTPTTSSNDSMQQPSQEARPAIPTADESKISVLALATHIESIALFYKLECLQKKASLAIKKIKQTKESGRNETLSVKKFNILIGSMLICFEKNRIRKTDDSISLESLLEHLQLFLIRPLGSDIVHEALQLVEQKIQEFEKKEDGVAPIRISKSFDYLLMAIGF
ncbi:unnamed protein product [Caenorhabditis nigoni]